MRLHTSRIASQLEIYEATKGLDGVYAEVTAHGSRSKEYAYEVSLEGNGYRKNTGLYGAAENFAATWDEWGVVIARLFDLDPDAFWGTAKRPTYANAEDFHRATGERFRSLELPDDTHKQHRWDPIGDRHYSCHSCTATHRIRS